MSATTSTGSITPFTPTNAGAFQFGATFDGVNYICVVTWNLWAQRWYLNVYTVTGDLIVARALIASPAGYGINLLFGYFFTSTMVFEDASQTFVVTP
jgi:hypothetical protein